MSGIDKLWLTTTDVKVKDLTNLNFGVNATRRQGGAELPRYTDIDGNTLECNSVFHKSKVAVYDYGIKGLRIILNPSKLHHAYNLVSTGNQFNDVINRVEADMKNLGIVADVKKMNIARIDLAKNEQMKYPVNSYHSVFNLVKGKRTENLKNINSYYIGNKQHEVCFYDKALEVMHEHNGKYYEQLPDNFMRCEDRLKKTKQVLKFTGISTLNDLIETAPNELDLIRKTYLQKVIFNRLKLGTQAVINWDTEVDFFQKIKSDMPKKYFLHWLTIRSVDSLMNDFGTLDNVKKFLYHAGENKSAIHKNINRLQDIIFEASKYKNEIPTTELLDEIVEKFVA